MKDKKDVTLITSLYKGGAFIRQFLENITAQTAWGKCELFIVDAHSPDGEYEIIKEFMDKYENIKYRRLDKDPGIYAVWNYAIENSNSRYITNANVDDVLFPECIEKHIALLDSNPDVDLAYCINLETDTYGIPESGESRSFPTGEFSLYNMLLCNLPHNHPVWRRELHKKYGFFDETLHSASDWDFWLRCAALGSKFKLIPEPLGSYYRNPDGISSSKKNMDRNLKEVKAVRDKFVRMLSYLKQSAQ
jgi:glycosyltransferase involved in cell wall biosynthesis